MAWWRAVGLDGTFLRATEGRQKEPYRYSTEPLRHHAADSRLPPGTRRLCRKTPAQLLSSSSVSPPSSSIIDRWTIFPVYPHPGDLRVTSISVYWSRHLTRVLGTPWLQWRSVLKERHAFLNNIAMRGQPDQIGSAVPPAPVRPSRGHCLEEKCTAASHHPRSSPILQPSKHSAPPCLRPLLSWQPHTPMTPTR